MRVVIDGGTWGNQRGYGRYTRELVTALGRRGRHDYVLVLDDRTAQADPPAPAGVSTRIVRLGAAPSSAAAADGWRSPLDLWRMGRGLAQAAGDVVFFPSVYTFVPVPARTPVVVTIHDVIAERWPSLIFATPRARRFWQAKLWLARWQARRVLTVSEHAARGLHEIFGMAPARIGISGEAPASIFQPVTDRARVDAALGLSGVAAADVLVYVGGLAPHKNLAALIRVFARLVRERPRQPLALLLVGDYEGDVFLSAYPALRALVERECPGRVRFTGRLSDEQLAALFTGACAVVLPSMDEGFGLPAVEAAACGAAVVATRHSAMPAVLGDGALYVDPAADESLLTALVRVLDDPAGRAAMAARGASRARQLSWAGVAERVEATLETAVRDRRWP